MSINSPGKKEVIQMKFNRLVRIALVAVLAITPLASTACREKTPTEKLAIFTAQSATALDAFSHAVEALEAAGKMSPASAKSIYGLNLKVNTALDTIRSRAQTGFDKAEALTIIDNILSDLRKAEADGVVTLSGRDKEIFLKVTFFVQFSVRSIQAIVQAAQPPAVPASELAYAKSLQKDESTVWTDLVLILQNAVIRGIVQSRMSAADAFADGAATSAALRAFLTGKLA